MRTNISTGNAVLSEASRCSGPMGTSPVRPMEGRKGLGLQPDPQPLAKRRGRALGRKLPPRDVLDHVIPLNEHHLKRVLSEYSVITTTTEPTSGWARKHQAAEFVQQPGVVLILNPRLGGLHHRYDRTAQTASRDDLGTLALLRGEVSRVPRQSRAQDCPSNISPPEPTFVQASKSSPTINLL